MLGVRPACFVGAAVSLSTLGTGLLAEPLATSAAAATSSAVAEVAAAAAPVAAAPASMSGTAAATYGITALRDPAVNRWATATPAGQAHPADGTAFGTAQPICIACKPVSWLHPWLHPLRNLGRNRHS